MLMVQVMSMVPLKDTQPKISSSTIQQQPNFISPKTFYEEKKNHKIHTL